VRITLISRQVGLSHQPNSLYQELEQNGLSDFPEFFLQLKDYSLYQELLEQN
jgi:hypothetical protein